MRHPLRRVRELQGQNFAHTAWSHATVCQSDEKLFVAFANAAERRVKTQYRPCFDLVAALWFRLPSVVLIHGPLLHPLVPNARAEEQP